MYDRAQTILAGTSGLSAFKLLLATARQTRPWLDSFARGTLKLLSSDSEVSYRYRRFGSKRRGLLRLSQLDSDLQSALELAVGDCYRLSQLPEPDLIVDGGANTGMFSLAASARWPTVPIIACEPVPDNVAAICKHLTLNDLTNTVELHEAALGGKEYSLDFFVREANQGSFDETLPYSSVIQVDVKPLRSFLADRTFKRLLIKLDIEGAERDVLEAFFSKPVAEDVIIVMEVHDLRNNRRFVEDLAEKNDLSLEFFELGGDTGHCQLTSKTWVAETLAPVA